MVIRIINILEEKYILKELLKRNLIEQYKRKKLQILNNNFSGNFLKLRQPKKNNIWYFRINKQFRALARLDGQTLIVFDIDNHQN